MVPSVLPSSICWSLQCLISALTQGGQWWTLFLFFLGSLVQSRCGEGGMLQTNNTVMCMQCLSPAGPAPARGTQTAQALHCSAGNGLRLALGCMHLPSLSRSGSPQRHRFCWDCILCPSQVRVAQVFGKRSYRTYCLFHLCCSVFWVYLWHPL